ncbi:hypothetical protein B9N43_05850 [Denitratisoma sp. DHT3]|uniref:hypothetical protein n=1 Tax=Denitratisoma sp. DHT3 TaxID=1981880 RepID=UPI0011988A74|nr:hypothetical protein [Denitratisoma sp. DHT3]QDX80807.1 hypothetical protein B9N43_05850 [Denitratisoma sp. DHT3]
MAYALTTIAPLVGAVAAVALGVFGFLRPRVMGEQTGLSPQGGLGVMELRALFGGLWLTLGTAALVLRTPEAYLMAGLAFGGITLGKIVGLIIDRPQGRQALGGTVVDGVFSLLLLSGYCAAGA